MLKKISILLLMSCLIYSPAFATIKIVAAENTYGSIVKELGGPYVDVTNIIDNPNQDPHLFSTTPSTVKMISTANIIIYNGADYDPWIKPLLTFSKLPSSRIIVVAALMKIKTGSNPHIWYLPTTMPLVAQTISRDLQTLDPKHSDYFSQQLTLFNDHYKAINLTIEKLHKKYNGIVITATEPVFNYMAENIGLRIIGTDFQNSIMNDVPPTMSQIKNYEDSLRQHTVKLLIFNNQVASPLVNRMKTLAQQQNIPVLGVGEVLPSNISYVQWVMSDLNAIEQALSKSNSS